MPISRRDLARLAGEGAGLTLTIDPSFRRSELVTIAAAGRPHGAPLTLLNVGHLHGADLAAIAAANPGRVTFEVAPSLREDEKGSTWEGDTSAE